jgi:hypothetical protein
MEEKTESQLLWGTLAVAGKIALVICLLIGGCIYLGSDNRSPMEKAIAEAQKNCNIAKQVGDASRIAKYCK